MHLGQASTQQKCLGFENYRIAVLYTQLLSARCRYQPRKDCFRFLDVNSMVTTTGNKHTNKQKKPINKQQQNQTNKNKLTKQKQNPPKI